MVWGGMHAAQFKRRHPGTWSRDDGANGAVQCAMGARNDTSKEYVLPKNSAGSALL